MGSSTVSIFLSKVCQYRPDYFGVDFGDDDVLPNFTTSTAEGTYSLAQMAFVAAASLVLYGSFIMVQTVRHRDYFFGGR